MVSYEKGRVYMGVWLKTDIGRRVDRVLGLMGTNPSQMQDALSAPACAVRVAPHVLCSLCLIRSSMSFLSCTFRWSIDELILHIPHFCFRGMLWDRRRQKVSKSRRNGLDSLWHTVLQVILILAITGSNTVQVVGRRLVMFCGPRALQLGPRTRFSPAWIPSLNARLC